MNIRLDWVSDTSRYTTIKPKGGEEVSKNSTTERIFEYATNESRICEMSCDTQLINVPVDPRIDISTITADDSDPKFVNVEILRAGISKGNRRRYNNNIVKEVNSMVAGCQGFFGHPDPSKYGFEFREPQCIFVGSVIEHMPDGLDRCIGKAYLFKTSPLREWIPKSIAAGNPMTVSINGTGDVMKNGDILDVIHMTDLQSIDWANPGTEGMETSKAMSVVSEMNKGGSGVMEMNAQEIIKNATVTEFKAFNPDGYDAIVKGVTLAELQAVNPELVESIKESAKITEMSLVRDGKEGMVKLADIQGIVKGYEDKITEMTKEKEESELAAYKTQKITEMVDEAHREAFTKRVSGNSKEEIDASITEQINFVREMGGTVNAPKNSGTGNKLGSEDMKAAVRQMFGIKENK